MRLPEDFGERMVALHLRSSLPRLARIAWMYRKGRKGKGLTGRSTRVTGPDEWEPFRSVKGRR